MSKIPSASKLDTIQHIKNTLYFKKTAYFPYQFGHQNFNAASIGIAAHDFYNSLIYKIVSGTHKKKIKMCFPDNNEWILQTCKLTENY